MADYLKELISKTKRSQRQLAKERDERIRNVSELKRIHPQPPKPAEVERPFKEFKQEIKREPIQIPKEQKTEKKPERFEWKREEIAKEKEPVERAPDVESEIQKVAEKGKRIDIASYGEVKIFKIQGQPQLYYFVPVPRPTASEKTIINTIKEAATRLISIAPYRIRDPQQRRNVYYQKVLDILHSSPDLNIPERRFEFYAEAVVREMVGYGIIDTLIKDDKLEEIMVIAAKKPVYVFHREYEMMITNIEFYSDNEIQDLINRIAREIGRRVDISSPLLDARLPDGSRVNATIPPASVSGSSLTIRKFREEPYSLVDIITLGTINDEVAGFLWMCTEGIGASPANLLITGGTGSGKTTFLNVLSSLIMPTERIVSIEDTAELNLPLDHWIRLEARPPGLEGTGELTLDILTKNSLRMRPDRIIVGEVRHDEAFTLFTAMNTGHDGSMGTLHANSSAEAVVRVTSPPMNVPEVMLSGLDLIVVEQKIHDRKKGTIRRITEIAEISGVLEGKARTQILYERDPVEDALKRTNVPSAYLDKLGRLTGLSRKQLEAEIAQRAKFLRKLIEKNIHSMKEVSRACQLYLEAKKQNA